MQWKYLKKDKFPIKIEVKNLRKNCWKYLSILYHFNIVKAFSTNISFCRTGYSISELYIVVRFLKVTAPPPQDPPFYIGLANAISSKINITSLSISLCTISALENTCKFQFRPVGVRYGRHEVIYIKYAAIMDIMRSFYTCISTELRVFWYRNLFKQNLDFFLYLHYLKYTAQTWKTLETVENFCNGKSVPPG